MPVVGVNVLENPDFSEVGDGGRVAKWIGDATWDPLLCWGVGGFAAHHANDQEAGIGSPAPNQLLVDWGASTQLDPIYGYPGLLYAGEGFDAVPGDTWRIELTADRAVFVSNYRGIVLDAYGPTTDLFIRFGITVKTGPGEWTSYYKNLTDWASPHGGTLVMDEEFEIPSNWPEGQYHFAVCTSGHSALPPNNVGQTMTWGMRQFFSNAALRLVSSGSGSPGPAGVLNPYVGWPVPRWADGSPLPCPNCNGTLEWDQWQNREPMTSDETTFGYQPHLVIFGPTTRGRIENHLFGTTGHPVAPGATEFSWVNGCAENCAYLSQYYVAVPIREWLYITFGAVEQWFNTPAFIPHITHPSSFAGRDDGLAYPFSPTVAPLPSDHSAIFCWANPCDQPPPPPPGGGAQPLYLTHEVAPGDPNIPAGGTGALNLRAIRAAPGDGSGAGAGSGGVHLGGVKGQP